MILWEVTHLVLRTKYSIRIRWTPWLLMPWLLTWPGHWHSDQWYWPFNSLAPGKFEWNFRYVIFKWILVIDGWGISCEIALIWMSVDCDDQSTLVQVMAWCRQATSHYLSQCWPRSLSPYGVTSPQWVKITRFLVSMRNDKHFVWFYMKCKLYIHVFWKKKKKSTFQGLMFMT